MKKTPVTITEKDLLARLDAPLLASLKRDAGGRWKELLVQAQKTWPSDAGLAAVRLLQLCGRVPTDEQCLQLMKKVSLMNAESEETPTEPVTAA